MSLRLDELVQATRDSLERRKRERPISQLEHELAARGEGRPFQEALSQPRTSLIAEYKRRSPSAGVIREGVSVAEIVHAYEHGGAAAISVLTEERHFGGSLEDLYEARRATELPILRKDFCVDLYQLYEAKVAGADAVLLVVGSLRANDLERLYGEAQALDLDAIVEVHDEEELECALELDVDVIGINNRNLEDFTVDIQTTVDLLAAVPTGKTVVSESGIRTRQEIEELERIGVDAVLIGETLMRAPDPEDAVRELTRPEEQDDMASQDVSVAAVAELGERLRRNVSRAVRAPDEALRDVIVALVADGHVLIEDYPGVGKTALARALARSISAEFARVQCTSDLLPSDVVGTNVYNQRENRFEFRPGPVFANVVLVDEVNRASPKTQSGLLESMQERSVTVDGYTHELARPFMVLATQNPVEYEGTYPLPEAQLDRFTMRVQLGYPPANEEAAMLADHAVRDQVLDLEAVADVAEVTAAQESAGGVHASEPLRRYIVALLERTRDDSRTELGASPRAGLMLLKAAKALAALSSRDHVLPDDVQALAVTVLSHRLLLAPEAAGVSRREIVEDALERIPAL